jgi:hypothetical protein
VSNTIRFHATSEVIRTEIPSLSVSMQDDAAIAVSYSARGRVVVIAVGQDALALPERLLTLDLRDAKTKEERRARIVSSEHAPWWVDGGPVVNGPSFDTAAHVGEILLLRPFAPETFSPTLIQAALRYMAYKALHLAPSVDLIRTWRLITARMEIELDYVPEDDVAHDRLVRALMTGLARNPPTLNGAPMRVRRPRMLSELGREEIARIVICLLLPVVVTLLVRTGRLRVHPSSIGIFYVVVAVFTVLLLVGQYRDFKYR